MLHLGSYREIATGTNGAFMAPADVAVLIGEIDRLRKALTDIEEGTVLVFDESEECEVQVWMDSEDMQKIARDALADAAPTGSTSAPHPEGTNR